MHIVSSQDGVLLPFPVSVNQMYRSVAGRTIKSKRYRQWFQRAKAHLMIERIPPIDGPVAVSIVFVPPDKRRRDPDNFTKGVLDVLVDMGVISDDNISIIRKLDITWREDGPVGATVTVQKWN